MRIRAVGVAGGGIGVWGPGRVTGALVHKVARGGGGWV